MSLHGINTKKLQKHTDTLDLKVKCFIIIFTVSNIDIYVLQEGVSRLVCTTRFLGMLTVKCGGHE